MRTVVQRNSRKNDPVVTKSETDQDRSKGGTPPPVPRPAPLRALATGVDMFGPAEFPNIFGPTGRDELMEKIGLVRVAMLDFSGERLDQFVDGQEVIAVFIHAAAPDRVVTLE